MRDRSLFVKLAFLPLLWSLTGCLPRLPLANANPSPALFQTQVWPDPVRPLPGGLDSVPMFNSNSPEWIKQPGILLSTFPPEGKRTPAAHLNYAFKGEFTLFSHHFTHTPPDLRTLYLGILVHNPNATPVTLTIPAVASSLMEPDAPFKTLSPMVENPNGEVFSGPGIRSVDQVLRDRHQADFPETVVIPPNQSRLIMNHGIAVKGLAKPINGRSTFIRLQSSDAVYVAELAMFAPTDSAGKERAPTLAEWQTLLETGGLAGPRDKLPTPPGQGGVLIYSRVAGVQPGSRWQATLTDPDTPTLRLPDPGKGIIYALSTLRAGRLGTEQSQAAPLVVRYGDTAYEAHGNYGVHYDLTLPLYNPSTKAQTVVLTLATPIKEEKLQKAGVQFRNPPQTHPFFRGTIRVAYTDEAGQAVTRYVHLWQRTGQWVDPFLKLTLPPQASSTVRVDFLYPPDATPPQILRIATLDRAT